MKQISAPSEFLSDLVVAKRLITDRADLIHVYSARFGQFVGLDGDREELTQVRCLDDYLSDKNLSCVKEKELGTHAVRDLFNRKLKINVPDEPTIRIGAWLNIVIPNGDLIDKTKIRIEAYTNEGAANHDADLEREDINVQAVITKFFTLKSP